MNYALYTSASAILTSMYRQDVAANNLANIDTTGFKAQLTTVMHRDSARVEDGLLNLPSNRMLDRLGAGVLMAPNRVDLGQGELSTTDNPLDFAIAGDGFFVVASREGTDGARLRLSRDGRFTLDGDGRLVQSASGRSVLDDHDRPIRLDPRYAVAVDDDGVIRQGGAAVARLGLVQVPSPEALTPDGDGALRPNNTAIESRRPADGTIRQGMVERSTVDPIEAMMAVTSSGRAVAGNARMVSMVDELMGRLINTFASVG